MSGMTPRPTTCITTVVSPTDALDVVTHLGVDRLERLRAEHDLVRGRRRSAVEHDRLDRPLHRLHGEHVDAAAANDDAPVGPGRELRHLGPRGDRRDHGVAHVGARLVAADGVPALAVETRRGEQVVEAGVEAEGGARPRRRQGSAPTSSRPRQDRAVRPCPRSSAMRTPAMQLCGRRSLPGEGHDARGLPPSGTRPRQRLSIPLAVRRGRRIRGRPRAPPPHRYRGRSDRSQPRGPSPPRGPCQIGISGDSAIAIAKRQRNSRRQPRPPPRAPSASAVS